MPSEGRLAGTAPRSADVVVAGGGLSGIMAARTAARHGARVVLLDKARAGTSGPTAFAAGDILCWLPDEDSLPQWVDGYLEAGQGLNSRAWLERLFQEGHRYISGLVAEGFHLETDPDGRWTRRSGRGPIVRCVLAPMLRWQEMARRQCLDLGVTILDRVAAQRIVTDRGQVAGLIGFHVRTGEPVAIGARSVVLASGGCSYRGLFFGQNTVAGEALSMALRAGASLAYMEYGNHYNVSLLRYPTYGQSKFMAHGGRYVNRLGEPFLLSPAQRAGHRASGNEAVAAMVEEVRAGRGPIRLDLSGYREWDMVARLMPNLVRLLERAGLQRVASPEEVVPAFTGTSNASAAGIPIGPSGQTGVPGLFAAGDAAAKGHVIGACIGTTGVSLAWANLTGHLAGAGAAAHAAGCQDAADSRDLLREAAGILEPVASNRPGSARQLLIHLSELMGRPDVSLIRREDRLQAALSQVRDWALQLHETGAADPHDLMVWHETASSLTCAEATLRSALARRESRGGHMREDCPDTRPEMSFVLQARTGPDGLRVEGVPADSLGLEAPR